MNFTACELYLNNAVIKKEQMQKREQGCGKMETTDLLEVGNWKVSFFPVIVVLMLFVQ